MVIAEHLIVIIMFVLDKAIDDRPDWILKNEKIQKHKLKLDTMNMKKKFSVYKKKEQNENHSVWRSRMLAGGKSFNQKYL